MSSIFNIYSNLSSTYWKPVDFELVGDDFSFKKTKVVLNNGVTFNLHNYLKDVEDFSFNRKTGFFLTGPQFNQNFLEGNKKPLYSDNLTKIETLLFNLSTNLVTIKPVNASLNSSKALYDSRNDIFSIKDKVSFIFSENTVRVQNSDGYFLTVSSFNTPLPFTPRISPPSDTQAFNYLLGVSSIVLFEYGTNFSNIVIRNPDTQFFVMSPYTDITDDSVFTFASFSKYDLNTNNTILNNFLVKYVSDPTISQKELIVDKTFNADNVLAQNYIGIFPVENPKIDDKSVSYKIQTHGLKNYQTPEYTYTTGSPYLSSSDSIRRIYNKLFTGTNQNKGYDKVYLGYQADTKEFLFKVDQNTPFYFPATNNSYPLSTAGLIEDGSTAGEIPFVSDRISFYRTNYAETLLGVDQPKSIKKYDNTWVCSWLSGTDLGEKIWVDRYYNSAYYSLDQALTAKAYVYNDKIDPTKQYTFDIPSTMVLEPNVYYNYFRCGKGSSIEFIKHLNFDQNNPLGSNVLSISSWHSSPLIDNSNYKNNGIVYNTLPENFKDNHLVLDGTNHVIFPSRSSLLQNNRLTVSLWLNVDDWNNIYGEQIFGNYYDSGFGFINDSAVTSPLFTIINNATLSAFNINYNLLNVSNTFIPQLSSNPNYNIIQRLPDFSYWVFDSQNRKGIKYDQYNKVLKNISFSQYIYTLSQVELDKYQNMYLYDNKYKRYVKLDLNGKYLAFKQFYKDDNETVDNRVNRIEIIFGDTVVKSYGDSSIVDNNNNVWEVVGGNLYKNKVIYANVGSTQQITCDSNNNLWISHLQDRISKLNIDKGVFEMSKRVGKRVGIPLDPCLNQDKFRYIDFVKVYVNKANALCGSTVGTYEDRLVILDSRDNEIYVLNTDGTLSGKIDLRTYLSVRDEKMNFAAKGDFSGYQYLRKYNSVLKNMSWKFKIAYPNGENSAIYSLPYDVSQLPPGWHNFTFVFDAFNGTAKYYIDSVKVNEASFDKNTYELYYNYRSSLSIGAATIKNTTLNDLIGIDDGYKFIGKISDIKLYSKALTKGEIEQIYFSSEFSNPRQDLVWNMRVGNRNYIEEIEYWYKMQLPGSKSKYFNINIHNLNIDNVEVKALIEDAIRANVAKITPAESSLYKINWT